MPAGRVMTGTLPRTLRPVASARAKKATTVLHWLHPHRGDQEETLCDKHLQRVLDALQTLGIGCIGTNAAAGHLCVRCHKSLPWRHYIAPGAQP